MGRRTTRRCHQGCINRNFLIDVGIMNGGKKLTLKFDGNFNSAINNKHNEIKI